MAEARRAELTLSVTERQDAFIRATASEVLFGGAAGGGKSFGQLVDAFLYALRYPRSKQLILRRTYAELEKSLIRTSLGLYPRSVYSYNASAHVGRFTNGSLIDFGYSAIESDVFQYQSAEYDVIRFDELTHFTEFQYLYMLSRLRGANSYPKQIKSSTNPGGIGHVWVKERFIDPAPPETLITGESGTRLYLPSRIDDNPFLAEGDPGYKRRLLALPEAERRALLDGDWNLYSERYFSEFSYETHTVCTDEIQPHWRKYRTIDYGLDRLACLWVALDEDGGVHVYREHCVSDRIISDACREIIAMTPPGERIHATLAPPDLWARSQESGRSRALLFAEHGITLTKSANDRVTGWLAVKELMKADSRPPRLRISRCCTELIKCLPMLMRDRLDPSDAASEPHAITHAPDALRYFAIYYSRPEPIEDRVVRRPWTPDMHADFAHASAEERRILLARYGLPE